MTAENIDMFRSEKRFFIPAASTPRLLAFLKKVALFPVKYSNKIITRTVYLIDDEQKWTLGVSLKARHYLKYYSTEILLKDIQDCLYRFEIKKEISGTELREKEKKKSATLREAMRWAREYFSEIRPYLVIEYKRQHFMPDGLEQWLRFTVDTNVRYWFFPRGKLEAVLVKDFDTVEDITRLEIKVNPLRKSEILVEKLLKELEDFGAMPVISKKQEGLNTIKAYLDKYYANPLVKELKDCEIEAKFTIKSPINPNIFFADLKNFCQTETKPIPVDPLYPFTMTTSSVNHYWGWSTKNGLKEGLKILSRGMKSRPVLKSESRDIDSGLGILERKEIKGKPFSIVNISFSDVVRKEEPELGKLMYVGYLFRSRKAIWIRNELTGRIYHVSLDKCTVPGKNPLYQIEIEYSGMLKRKENILLEHAEAKKIIIEESKFLAEKILSFAKNKSIILSPGIEKFGWLINRESLDN